MSNARASGFGKRESQRTQRKKRGESSAPSALSVVFLIADNGNDNLPPVRNEAVFE
jgi:hypothetical protein